MKNNTDLISIIVPVYNAELYLKDCIDSILLQTYSNFEVIFVDDLSTDNSVKIIQDYLEKDTRLQLILFNKNKGAGPARNKGIDTSKGEFIIFCDPDDVYPSDALENLYNAIKNTDADFSAGNIQLRDDSLQYCLQFHESVAPIYIGENKIVNPKTYYPFYLPIFHVRFLFRTKFIKNNNIYYPDLLRGQDTPMLAKAITSSNKAIVIPNVVYYYRGSQKNKINTYKKIEDYFSRINLVVDIFRKKSLHLHADMYICYSAQNLTNASFYKNYNKSQQKNIIYLFEKLFRTVTQTDFPPYISDKNIKKNFFILKHNIFIYIIIKLFNKLKCIFIRYHNDINSQSAKNS